MTADLSVAERQRYSRQILMPELGIDGQRRLKDARVLIVGAGGLGSPAALYLTAAGIGTLGLAEFDRVDETNLQRQILFDTRDVGRPKLEAAVDRLRALNPHVGVEPHEGPLDADNARALVSAYDVVVDGSDNFPTRYLVNDACVLTRTPNVYGSVQQFTGQAAVFGASDGPCYRCLHPEPPPDGLIPDCAAGGVLGVMPGLIGTVQATEAIKLVTGVGEPLIGRLFLADVWRARFRTIELPADPECPVCGSAPSITSLVAYAPVCEAAGAHAPAAAIACEEYRAWCRDGRAHVLVDVREPEEHARDHIDGSILMPLRQLAARLGGLPTDRPVVVHCETGLRSERATALLRARGYDARNLTGGIRAWHARYPRTRSAVADS